MRIRPGQEAGSESLVNRLCRFLFETKGLFVELFGDKPEEAGGHKVEIFPGMSAVRGLQVGLIGDAN